MKQIFSRFPILIAEIILTICICISIVLTSIANLKSDSSQFIDEISNNYQTLVSGYASVFKAMTIPVRDELDKNPSFEELDQWLKIHEPQFKAAVGSQIYDGFALTYKGKYAHSWDYGDYSNYDPATRIWYQQAQKAGGNVVIVAPYVTYLASSNQPSNNPITLSVVQKYTNEIAFDLDLKTKGINALLADQNLGYAGTLTLLFDKQGYILSSNNPQYYSHNIQKVDNVISPDLCHHLQKNLETADIFTLNNIDGEYRLLYIAPGKNGNIFCISYSFWTIFLHNFLAIILITIVLIIFEITLFFKNRRKFSRLSERDCWITRIASAAFETQWEIDVATMQLKSNSGLSPSRNYGDLYDSMEATICSTAGKNKFTQMFAPEALRKNTEEGINTLRLPVMMTGKNGRRERHIIECSLMVYHVKGRKLATILTNDVTEDENHTLMILHSIAYHYSLVLIGNINTKEYVVIKSNAADSNSGEWNIQQIADYMKPEYRDAFLQTLDFTMIAERFQKSDTSGIAVEFKDGHSYLAKLIRSLTYEESGEFFLCLENVDEQMQTQKALEKALSQANIAVRAKTDFLSRMSHDIRTPLNGIIGMTAIAQSINHDEKVENCLTTIHSSGHFLLNLINDILDIAKIESGKLSLNEKPTSINEIQTMLDAVIQPLMDEKHLHFKQDISIQTKYALVDIVRFNQIFFNLLSNSAKYTEPGGSVLFSATSLRTEGTTEWVRFLVSDTGIGMSEDFLDKAFKPFEQERSSNENLQWTGTGLGLAIVKELTDKMNGHISVISHKGKGTQFYIELPLQQCQEQPAQKAVDIPLDDLAGKTILLAEDNEINTIVVTTLLENKGMQVIHAVHGKAALERFAASYRDIDLILMDILMPVMNGIEATKMIRKLDTPKAAAVPIIAVTANAFTEDVQACLDAGMDAHISKPINPDELYKTLARFLCQPVVPPEKKV